MIQIVPFEAGHLARLDLQEAQRFVKTYFRPDYAQGLQEAGEAWTALHGDRVIGCAGLIEAWPGRTTAWALLGDAGPAAFRRIHTAVKRSLEQCPGRVEITVACDHVEGHRWARLLGFELEAERMRAYTPDGRDCALYARVAQGNEHQWIR